jgi:hypothetical protein
MPKMRAKMVVSSVTTHDQESSETLTFSAVAKTDGYLEDGSDENNSFARWTPSANLTLLVSNPALVGQFKVNQEYYLDFTLVE